MTAAPMHPIPGAGGKKKKLEMSNATEDFSHKKAKTVPSAIVGNLYPHLNDCPIET